LDFLRDGASPFFLAGLSGAANILLCIASGKLA
jgi:hypothetical protein